MKKLLALMMILLITLAGCSSAKSFDVSQDLVLKWENGVITFNGDVVPVSWHRGYEAKADSSVGKGGLTYSITLDNAKDVSNISVNNQGILEENMDKYNGKFYYTEFLGSKLTMANALGNDNWKVVQVLTNNLAPNLVATYADEFMDSVPLTNASLYVDFGPFKFGNEYDVVEVRTDCALILGIAKVSQGTYETTSTVSVFQNNKEYQVAKGSSSKYDYYVYEGYLIQLASGLDLGSYVTFK